jgi:hypothetical protein
MVARLEQGIQPKLSTSAAKAASFQAFEHAEKLAPVGCCSGGAKLLDL